MPTIKKVTFRPQKNHNMVTIYLSPGFPRHLAEQLVFDRGVSWTGSDGTIEEIEVCDMLEKIPTQYRKTMHSADSLRLTREKRKQELVKRKSEELKSILAGVPDDIRALILDTIKP